MCMGREELRKAIEDAELYPIQGLFRFSNYFHEIDSYYTLCHGDELGVSTGWNGVDEFYRVSMYHSFFFIYIHSMNLILTILDSYEAVYFMKYLVHS